MTPEEVKGITDGIKTMQENLKKIEEKALAKETQDAEALKVVNEAKTKLAEIEEKMKGNVTADEVKTLLKEHGTEFQKQFDDLAVALKTNNKVFGGENKTVSEAIMDGVKEFFPDYNPNPVGVQVKQQPANSGLLAKFHNNRYAKHRIDLAANTILPMDVDMHQKTMTLADNLTGNPFASQDPRLALFPMQKINARDLLPTFQTETGYYVYWKEDAGETNNISFQTEGSEKGQNNYSLTGTGVAEQFLSGISTFSKQMVNSLPFLTQYLPQMLMRDFYKKENAAAYAVMATGTGSTTITSTSDNVEKIIYYIANQLTGNYNASFAIVSPADYAKLVVSTYTKGYYPGAGTVTYNGTSLTLDGVPIIRATWATPGKVVIIDRDFMQRVQVSGLAIELSYENDKNFEKNLITARIECQEQFVLQLEPSAIYGDLA